MKKGSNSFSDKGLYMINSLYEEGTKNTIIIFSITFSELCNSLQFNQKFTEQNLRMCYNFITQKMKES